MFLMHMRLYHDSLCQAHGLVVDAEVLCIPFLFITVEEIMVWSFRITQQEELELKMTGENWIYIHIYRKPKGL